MSSKSFNTCRTNNHHQAKKPALQQQLTAFQHHQQPSHFPVFTSATSHPTLSNYQPPQSQYATTSYLHQFHNLNSEWIGLFIINVDYLFFLSCRISWCDPVLCFVGVCEVFFLHSQLVTNSTCCLLSIWYSSDNVSTSIKLISVCRLF